MLKASSAVAPEGLDSQRRLGVAEAHSPFQHGEQRPDRHAGQGGAERPVVLLTSCVATCRNLPVTEHAARRVEIFERVPHLIHEAGACNLLADQRHEKAHPAVWWQAVEVSSVLPVQVHRALEVWEVAVGATGGVRASARGEEHARPRAAEWMSDAPLVLHGRNLRSLICGALHTGDERINCRCGPLEHRCRSFADARQSWRLDRLWRVHRQLHRCRFAPFEPAV
mmetsp:Transcript_113515/g.315782  ORF Transcript_113515/g.315782 Transcript_113515/m.315782 type:complete len:225 (-) Transcript_113515:309-983(-)